MTGITATAVWRVRPSGSNTNGGGYDADISGAGTDYSQQNAAQLAVTDAASTAATSIVTSVTGGFTAAMIGNAMYLSGTHFTTGFYFITGRTDTNTVTVDRDPTTGGNGSAGTYNVGGGWANFWTNTTANIVPGNIVYILGSGIPNPASYTYDYTSGTFFTPVAGNATAGRIVFTADPNTPNYSTGGRPVIKCGTTRGILFSSSSYATIDNLWFVPAVADTDVINVSTNTVISNCVCDQFGYDISFTKDSSCTVTMNNEVFSSVAARGTTAAYACVLLGVLGGELFANNIHDTVGPGVSATGDGYSIDNNIICKTTGPAILVTVSDTRGTCVIKNNTLDGGTTYGIEITNQASLAQAEIIVNNLITNFTGGSGVGIKVDAGTTAANDRVKGIVDYNCFYNNTANYSSISAGTHDTALGSDPYTGQSTENYKLNTANIDYTKAFPNAPFPQHYSGKTNTVQSYMSPGGVQPQASAGGGGLLTNPGMSGGIRG